jgi:hypothetical protein
MFANLSKVNAEFLYERFRLLNNLTAVVSLESNFEIKQFLID